MKAQVILPPALEPVSLTTLKSHLRLTHNSDDNILTHFITLAREWLEQKYGLALITQQWRFEYDLPFPSQGVDLKKRPVQEVNAFNLIDTAGVERLIASSTYLTTHDYKGTKVVLREGIAPKMNEEKFALTLTLGYGDLEEAVPAALKQAIILIATAFYEGRLSETTQQQSIDTLSGLKLLMAPYVQKRLHT